MADNLLQPAVLVADRGYDFDKVREDIGRRNALQMIFMRKNATRDVSLDERVIYLPSYGSRRRIGQYGLRPVL